MFNRVSLLAPVISASFLWGGVTSADVLLFDIDADEQAWREALNARGFEAMESWDFGLDPDYGIAALGGPVSCAGSAPVSPGIVPCNVSMDAPNNAGGGNNLDVVGPSAGFGNGSNAIIAGYYTDSFQITFTELDTSAVEFNTLSLLGSDTIDLTVFTDDGERHIFPALAAPAMGNRYGVLTTEDEIIELVEIFETGRGHGGIQGFGVPYMRRPLVDADLLGFDVVTGTLLAGDLNDVQESDDRYLRVRSGLGARISEAHLMEIVVSAHTSVTQPSALTLTLEARLNEPNGIAQVRLRNWPANTFDQVARYPVGLQDAQHVVENIDASDYIRPSGGIEISIKHIVFVPFLAFRFESFLDLVQIQVD